MIRNFLILSSLTIFGCMVFPCTSSRAGLIPNGGFESGLGRWEVVGSVNVVSSDFGSHPPEGLFQAALETGDETGGGATSEDLDQFFGFGAGELDRLSTGSAFGGSGIKTVFNAVAGHHLLVDFNYLTRDDIANPGLDYNDFAFVSIEGLALLADGFTPGFVASLTGYDFETGYRTFSYTIPVTGAYTLGIGVVNVGDPFFGSAILVDNVRLTQASIPEPSSLILSLCGLTLVGGFLWMMSFRKCNLMKFHRMGETVCSKT